MRGVPGAEIADVLLFYRGPERHILRVEGEVARGQHRPGLQLAPAQAVGRAPGVGTAARVHAAERLVAARRAGGRVFVAEGREVVAASRGAGQHDIVVARAVDLVETEPRFAPADAVVAFEIFGQFSRMAVVLFALIALAHGALVAAVAAVLVQDGGVAHPRAAMFRRHQHGLVQVQTRIALDALDEIVVGEELQSGAECDHSGTSSGLSILSSFSAKPRPGAMDAVSVVWRLPLMRNALFRVIFTADPRASG